MVQENPSPTAQGQQKFIIESPDGLDWSAPLPEGYGDNRLVILPRDPWWFFSYWEITGDRLNRARQDLGDALVQQARVVLRVYNSKRFFDVDIRLEARQWYVNVSEPGQPYWAELGWLLPDGRFVVLLSSNRIRLPMGRVSEQTDSQWMAVHQAAPEEDWQKLMEVSGATRIGKGSAEIAQAMAQRWEFLKSVFSGSFSGSLAPSAGSSRLSPPPPEEKP